MATSYLALYHDGFVWRAHSRHSTPVGAIKSVRQFRKTKIVPIDPKRLTPPSKKLRP